jgi:hypothetical protein
MSASAEELAKEITVALVSRVADFSMDKFLVRGDEIGKCAGSIYKEVLRAVREADNSPAYAFPETDPPSPR